MVQMTAECAPLDLHRMNSNESDPLLVSMVALGVYLNWFDQWKPRV